MPSTIEFLHEPRYTDTVILFILTPAGVRYDAQDIGSNLFGTAEWTDEHLLIDGLSPTHGFRYTDIHIHWSDFLDLAFQHADHALFYVAHKRAFKEIRKETLLNQNPDLYSFFFHKFFCPARTGMSLPAPSSDDSHLRLIRSTVLTPSRAYAEGRAENTLRPAASEEKSGNRSAAPRTTPATRRRTDTDSPLVDARYVAMDVEQLSSLLEHLSDVLDSSLDEFREIRSLLDKR